MKQRIIRRGAALLAVLVAIAAISIIMTVVTVQVVAQRKMVQARHQHLQADWLARAGVEWAAERLLHKPSAFTEEMSDLASEGTVRVVVEKADGSIFVITAEASLREEHKLAVVREVSGRFRRTQKDGRVRMERVSHNQ
jgi:peptide subunit release factor RF-3